MDEAEREEAARAAKKRRMSRLAPPRRGDVVQAGCGLVRSCSAARRRARSWASPSTGRIRVAGGAIGAGVGLVLAGISYLIGDHSDQATHMPPPKPTDEPELGHSTATPESRPTSQP